MYPYYQQSVVRVQSENDARTYPVAYGNSVMFIDENQPFVYTKTSDGQFGNSRFEKYRLVKEDTEPNKSVSQSPIDLSSYATKADVDALSGKLDALERRLDNEPTYEQPKRTHEPISDVHAEPRSILDR